MTKNCNKIDKYFLSSFFYYNFALCEKNYRHERIRKTNLHRFLYSISIPRQTISKQIMNYLYRDPLAEIMNKGRRSMIEDSVFS